MSEEVVSLVCPACGTRRRGSFRFCTRCGADLPALSPPSPSSPVPQPPPVARAVEPTADPKPAKSAPKKTGPAQPIPSPTAPPPGVVGPKQTTGPALPSFRSPIVWLPLSLLIVLIVGSMFREAAKQEIAVAIDPDHWVSVDPHRLLGGDREFFLRGEGPLRIRTSSGKPLLADGAPLALGTLGSGTLELKSVERAQVVTLVRR